MNYLQVILSRRSLIAIAIGLLAVVGSGCAGTAQASSAKVTVTPAVGLHDGQQVEVVVSGFPEIGEKVYLSECGSQTAVNRIGCGEQLAGQIFLLTDHGSGRTTFVVHHSAATGPLNAPRLACSTVCVLEATIGSLPGRRSVSAWVALRFASPG